jgi:hypothetical protein
MAKIDLSFSRECHIKDFRGQPGPCPNCGGPLRQEYASYMITTRCGKRITDSFVMGSDFGWFCPACPTVVIDSRGVESMLQAGTGRWDVGNEWALLGILDYDAVPHDKRHQPLGTDDNPYPLVELTYPEPPRRERRPEPPRTPKPAPAEPRPRKKTKRRRRGR